MKIVYMGTPEFAVPPLVEIVNAGHEIAAVITQPDKQRDRGKKVRLSPVKEKALDMGVPVWQPEKLKGNELLFEQLRGLGADCFVTAAYGKILPKDILDIPQLGCINIHGSLLPKYRGAAPVHRAILDGEPVTGVTIMYMDEGMDTGDMLSFCEAVVGRKTAAQLTSELSELGAELLIRTLDDLKSGKAVRMKQNEAEASYAPMLTKEEGRIDFAKPSEAIERQIRGLNPWPTAYTSYNGETVKIWEAEVINDLLTDSLNGGISGEISAVDVAGCVQPGTILRADKNGVAVQTGKGALLITRLQFPGKKAVHVKDYLLGNQIESGKVLGD